MPGPEVSSVMQRWPVLLWAACAVMAASCARHSAVEHRTGRLSPQEQVDSDAAVVNRRRFSIPTVGILGTVLDSAGRPAPRTTICIGRCAVVDSTGHYVIDRLLRGKYTVRIQCTSRERRIMAHGLFVDSVNLDVAGPHQLDWRVDTRGCDGRPILRRVGEWRGHFTSGFEVSGFVACPGNAWLVPSDSVMPPSTGVGAWAELSARALHRTDWPDATESSRGYTEHYVRWRGTVVGPARYGHLGVSDFEIDVDRILEIRAPRPDDCT
jgi:hypothetical protein